MKCKYTLALSLLLLSWLNLLAQDELNTIEQAMKDELERSMSELKSDKYEAPFFIRYRVIDNQSTQILASLGSLTNSMSQPSRIKEVRVMVGDYEFNDESLDDTSLDTNPPSFGYMDFTVPIGDDYYGIRRSLWITTDAIYKQAAQIYKGHLSSLEKDEKTLEDIEHRRFAQTPVVSYFEVVRDVPFTRVQLENFAKEASSYFLAHKDVFASSVLINSGVNTAYFLNSEGTRYRTSTPSTAIIISATMITEEGGLVYENQMINLDPDQPLPELTEMREAVDQMMNQLRRKDQAEAFKSRYFGPVLFVEKAVPQLFNSNLIQNLYAPTEILEEDYYSFNLEEEGIDKQLGEKVISKQLSVTLHTNLKSYNGEYLRGNYQIDDEGVMAPDTLKLIEEGILKNLMSSRTLLGEEQIANGTGSGPGVVFISATETSKESDLKQKLIELAKEEDLDYAIIVKGSSAFGGFNNIEVFKVDVETGEEELFAGATISGLDMNNLKKVEGISDQQMVSHFQGTSWYCPTMMIISDVGIGGSYQQVKMKKSLIESPLSGK